MSKFTTKLLLLGIIGLWMPIGATAAIKAANASGANAVTKAANASGASVAKEMKTQEHKAVKNPRATRKGNRKTVNPFRSNFTGLLQTPQAQEEQQSQAEGMRKAQAGVPTIYGSMIYSDDWYNITSGSYPEGYYAIQPVAGSKFQQIAIHPNLAVNGGGCYSDRMIHYHLWEMYADDSSATGIVFNDYYCVVNTDTWSFVNNPTANTTTDAYLAYDMTYDPVGKKIYAAQWGYYEDTYCNLASVDPMTGASIDIAKLPAMSVLASNNFGQLFGVGSADGMAYYINKENGELIPLGLTGVSPKYAQSATVDPETNTIYWAACLADETSALYTINTTTGKAEKIMNLPGNAELSGLFIEADRQGLNAPAQLENFILSSTDNTGKVSYTIPTKAFDGSSLSGTVTTYVYVDGKLAFTKSGAPGENVSGTFSVSSGSHTIVAYASTAAGEGVKTYRTQTTGKDIPGAPGNVTLTISGDKASLQWTAPTQGMNGGEFDPSTLTYTVVRYPGENIVAMAYKETSFSETLPAGTATYYYEVTAYADGEKGGTARSNAEFVGSAFTIPYSQDFEDENSMDGFTLIANEEGRGWYRWHNTAQNFKAAASKFNMQTQSNHWMILPTVMMEGGKEYHLNFKARAFSEEDPERFEITIGPSATVEAQTQTLMPVKTIANENWMDYSIAFKVSTDGTYNVGFHCVSPAMAYYLLIDDIEITDSSDFIDTPLAVTNLKARDEDENAVVTWTAPTKGVLGGDLKPELLSYEIYDSDGTLLESNYKGTSYTDTRYADRTSQKFIYYQVTPIHGEKRGESALCDYIILGPDNSLPFAESFSQQGLDNTPWALSTLAGNVSGCWSLESASSNPDATPQDGDGGMSVFLGYSIPTGGKARLTSPKLDLLSPAHPVLKFYVYKTVASRETLEVEISHNDNTFSTLGTVNLKDGNGWTLVTMEIPRKYCKASTMISFTATSGYGQNICLDNITVVDDESLAAGIDLQAADIEIPQSMMPGEEKEFKVTVFNNGDTAVSDYTVSLLCDGQVVNSTKSTETIEPGETYIYIFKATAEEEDNMHTYRFSGRVKCAGDINPDNDDTEAKELTIGLSGIGSVESGITVSASNGEIVIIGAEGLTARVYNLEGLQVASAECGNETRIALPHGFYIVRAGTRTEKIRL